MEVKIDLEGFEELGDKLQAIRGALKKELNKALEDTAEVVRDTAQQNAPVDTGTLMNSIEMVLENLGTYMAEAAVGTDLHYAPYQEFGTYKMQAQPYLRPAFDNNKSYIINRFEEAIKSAASQVAYV
jgi:HK97 gp10 family phage protein